MPKGKNNKLEGDAQSTEERHTIYTNKRERMRKKGEIRKKEKKIRGDYVHERTEG